MRCLRVLQSRLLIGLRDRSLCLAPLLLGLALALAPGLASRPGRGRLRRAESAELDPGSAVRGWLDGIELFRRALLK